MKELNETESAVAPNAMAGDGIQGYSPLLGEKKKKKNPAEMLADRIKAMKKDTPKKGNLNPLNNTFNNGNKELASNYSGEAIRKSFDKYTKEKEKKGMIRKTLRKIARR